MADCEVRTLLPVKGEDGRWVYPTEVVPVRNDDSDNNEIAETSAEEQGTDQSAGEEEDENEVVLPRSFVEKYAYEQLKLKNLKVRVGLLCSSVTSDPENHMKYLKELVLLLQQPQTKMIVTEKKLLALSLLRVFEDVLPGYRIRTDVEQDKKVKLKKETKKLLNYETSLVRYYKKYLDCLQKMVNGMKGKRQKTKITPARRRALREIGLIATKCLCDLLVTRYYFNYYKTIVNIVVPLACNRDSEIRRVCCTCIGNLYKADKLGETSLEAVKQTVKVIKERKFSVPPEIVRTFLALKLHEVKPEKKETKTDMKKARKEWDKMSRKERRYKKKMKELEVQLRETEAVESSEAKSKIQAEIMKKVFWVYFHVLKDDTKRTLVTPVLEGLSKFAHLINLEFLDDLNSVLSVLLESGNLSVIEKLHCMQTIFTILSGQAESLNIDPQRLYNHLYSILLDLEHCTDPDVFRAAIQCIEIMVMKRKKKITFNRALAFIKRLCTVSVQCPLHFTVAALLTARSMLMNTRSSDILLDTESVVGSGVYLPELEDPEYCNPGSTSLWELHYLKKHYNPVICDISNHILYSCPLQGRLQLTDALTKRSPEELLRMFSTAVLEHNVDPERYENPAKRLCVRKTLSEDLSHTLEMNTNVTWKHVKNVDFFSAHSS